MTQAAAPLPTPALPNGKNREYAHKFFAVFDKKGRTFAPEKFDFYPYQFYTNFNFPFRAIFQQIINDYNRFLKK